MSFSEAISAGTTNSGALGGPAAFVQQGGFPAFSTNVPRGAFVPSGNASAIDFGDIAAGQGGRAIDLTTVNGPLGTLNAFTVCGWLNARNLNEGPGGNRVAFALAAQNGPGFDLVQLASGALRIGINQWPDGSGGGGPISSSGKITADPAAGANNWVFCAVAYDSTLASSHLKYYFGKPGQAAALDTQHTYARGAAGPCGSFTAGNFSSVDTGARNASGSSSRVFRGLIDELRVFNRALSLTEIQAAQVAPAFRPVDSPPGVAEIVPSPGATVRRLEQIEVLFNEAVQGVDATDLLINGIPATNVVAVAPDEYVFMFPPPLTGAVTMVWASGHGIRDFAEVPNDFAGGGWTNVFDPNAAYALPILTEFMAENKGTLNDEDGNSSDWIEIYNPDVEPMSLEGYFLTDATNALAKWRFPAVVLAPNSYLVVFASEKNRTNPAAPLHTNFKLDKSGEYLALVDPSTNVISAFASRYPAQREDVSFGRDRLSLELTGYFVTPTPGRPNSSSGAGFAPDVQFSQPSGPFTTPFLLTLSTTDTDAVIRYLLVSDATSVANTNVPGPTSPIYTNALLITNTVQVRARAFAPNLLPGTPASETYLAFNTNVMQASSDLPILVVHTLGGGDFNQSTLKTAHLSVFEPVLGRTSFSNAPSVTTRAALRVRGNTSASSAKKSWTMETWDEFNDDKDVSLLGMPAESDWVLYGPASMEPVMIHNSFAYELARRLGHWAPRTRFVELYLNTAGGTITTSHYHGIYVLVEKVKVANGRIDEERMEPEITNGPALTGTYLMQVDRRESGESGMQIPSVQAGTHQYSGGNAITYTDPKESEIMLPQRAAQRSYILNYMTNFVNTLNSAGFADPVSGYPAYVNLEPSLRNHMVVTLCFSVDAFNFSTYFYKARNGKLTMGPIWDFDRALESKDDPRDDNPRQFRYVGSWEAFDFFNYSWFGRMFQDTNFWQRWVDRYQHLRQTELSQVSLNVLIDGLTGQLRESQVRDVARWPGVTTPRTSFQWEIDHMKEWLTNRLHFLDTNLLAMPVLNTPGGRISAGFVLQIAGPAVPAGTQVYYTLDGTDPRLSGGAISPSAILYTGPVTITNNAHVIARSRNLNHRNLTGGQSNGNPPATTPWSGPAEAVLVVNDVPLVITEIMYHPANAPFGNTNDADNFEFIELKNVGTTSLSLLGVRFTNGIDYTFTPGSAVTNLAPGGLVVLVKNLAAFQARYPGVTNVAGEFSGTLDNAGERLALIGGLAEPILDFTYSDEWYPITDGLGFSLVVADDHAPMAHWAVKSGWHVGAALGGSPGTDEPATPARPAVVISEALTHTDLPEVDVIELHNTTADTVDIGGWFLSDDFNQPRKFVISTPTLLSPGGFVTFSEWDFNVGLNGFALGSGGDEVYLFSGDGVNLTGYAHGFDFGAAANGVTFGRHVISTGEDHFVAQSANTLGTNNAGPRVGPIVISEIMYHPWDHVVGTNGYNNTDDEYIELRNLGDTPVTLWDDAFPTNTWRLRDAVDFDFPQDTVIQPHEFVLVVGFDPVAEPAALAAFRARSLVPETLRVFGPWSGSLDNDRDSVELRRPDPPDLDGSVPYVLVERVKYSDNLPWPAAADGLGMSLQRITPSTYGNDPANWVAVAPTPGAAFVPGGTPPEIVSQPGDQALVSYRSAALSVSATGSEPLRYQWRRNGLNLAGATNATLLLDPVLVSDAGTYNVFVFNSAGSVLGTNFTISVRVGLRILQEPEDVLVTAGTSTGFSVLAEGSGGLRYQWQLNGSNMVNATNSTLTVASAQTNNAGFYTVQITDDFDSVLSRPASLVISYRPTIIQQPQSVTVLAGQDAVFSVTASGTTPMLLRWRRNSIYFTNGVGCEITSGETNSALLMPGVSYLSDNDKITVVASNVASSAVVSSNAVLRVLHAPVLTSEPTNVVVNAGTNATFRAVFRANPAGAYAWWFNETNLLAWRTNAFSQNTFTNSLTVTNVQATDEGLYTLVLSNQYGLTTSTGATLSLRRRPTIVGQPQSQTVAVGSTASFSVGVTGTPPFRYSWKFNGTNLPAALGTNATLTLTNVQTSRQGNYFVVVTNLAGSATSQVATLTVRVQPELGGVVYNVGTGKMVFTVPTQVGASYVVEYKDELDAAEWQLLKTVTGDGTVVTIEDEVRQPAPTQRFYRVRLE